MNYLQILNNSNIPKSDHKTLVLDLFAGCGGLGLGFELEGFKTIGYEMEENAAKTYNNNLEGECKTEYLTEDSVFPEAGVIIGGPPCQPFSVGGNQKGTNDIRNGFPAFINAIKKVKPEIWMFENVRGLLYKNKWYFDEVIKELEQEGYVIEYKLLNAKNYGVPQNRERVIVVGHKGGFKFPTPFDYVITVGEAIGDLIETIPPESKFLTQSMNEYIKRYEIASKCITPRDLHPHLPARTLTCRNLAGATGDMHRIKLSDGRRRRILVREAARIQSFPDWFVFEGNEQSQFNQLGNAVPPLFAREIAKCIKSYLEERLIINKTKHMGENSMQENQFIKVGSKYSKGFFEKSIEVQELIQQALIILYKLGIPFESFTNRGLERIAMSLLALGDVKKSNDWINAKENMNLTTREIIKYLGLFA